MVERFRERLLARADLHRERTLPGSGGPAVEPEVLRDGVEAPEAPESGGGEHDRIELARGDLTQARVDVAPDVHDLEVGPTSLELRNASRRTRPDAGSGRQRVHREGVARAQRITSIRALGNRRDRQARMRRRRQILEGVHHDVDVAHEQRGA